MNITQIPRGDTRSDLYFMCMCACVRAGERANFDRNCSIIPEISIVFSGENEIIPGIYSE